MTDPHPTDHDFDYSSAEALRTLDNVTALILDIRREYPPMARRVTLYERTLGLAVIPVLLRRAFIKLFRQHRRVHEGRK